MSLLAQVAGRVGASSPLTDCRASTSPRVAGLAYGHGEAEMDSQGHENVREVSKLQRGDFISWWADQYVEVLDVRQESGLVFVSYLNPLTGVRVQSEYEPEDLVVIKRPGT
jgi:hypothetical protein